MLAVHHQKRNRLHLEKQTVVAFNATMRREGREEHFTIKLQNYHQESGLWCAEI